MGFDAYKTGDLAQYLPDGNIEFLGRVDHQVKIRGFRIELGEIETVLGQHPAIMENVVVIWETDMGEKSLVAYIVSTMESAPSLSELRRFLKQKLPKYMVPSTFIILETLPLMPNGKVNRRVLCQDSAFRLVGFQFHHCLYFLIVRKQIENHFAIQRVVLDNMAYVLFDRLSLYFFR